MGESEVCWLSMWVQCVGEIELSVWVQGGGKVWSGGSVGALGGCSVGVKYVCLYEMSNLSKKS